MKLFDIISVEYNRRKYAAGKLLQLENESTQLGNIFRKLQCLGDASSRAENQAEFDEYESAINERRFSSYSSGITYFKKYEDYDVIDYEVTRKRVHPSDKNDQTVVVIVLKYGDDVATIWWLPARNKLTYNHEEGNDSNV